MAVGGGIFSAITSGKAARDARRKQGAMDKQLLYLENNRQDVINPFAKAASMLSNPFANLTVATQAAEMQSQQSDLALASSLDTLRATGSGAGGATALAQAALKSKQGVSASIEQQEAKNNQLRAQGEQQLQNQLFQAEAKGQQFMFGAQEKREMQKMNRLSSLSSSYSQQAAGAQSQMMSGIGQAVGGLGTLASAGAFGGTKTQTPNDYETNVSGDEVQVENQFSRYADLPTFENQGFLNNGFFNGNIGLTNQQDYTFNPGG